jgi:transcription elongation factor Elf1
MTTRSRTNHIVGGKGKDATDAPPKENWKRAGVWCPDCNTKTEISLKTGPNEVVYACAGCGVLTRIFAISNGVDMGRLVSLETIILDEDEDQDATP